MKTGSNFLQGVFLFVLGVGLFGGGVYFLKDRLAFFNQSIQTEGVIISIESSRSGSKTHYSPRVSFQGKDSVTYTFTAGINSTAAFDYSEGESIMIRYLAEKPQVAKVDSFLEIWGLPFISIGVGLIILIAGISNIRNHFYKIKLQKELPLTGTLIKLVGRVELQESKSRRDFIVVSNWFNPKDSKMYRFSSKKIPYDPTSFITDRLMDVWIDPMNPKKRHYMDISFLPKES